MPLLSRLAFRREPEAETKDAPEASEAAAAEYQKQQKPRTGQREQQREHQREHGGSQRR